MHGRTEDRIDFPHSVIDPNEQNWADTEAKSGDNPELAPPRYEHPDRKNAEEYLNEAIENWRKATGDPVAEAAALLTLHHKVDWLQELLPLSTILPRPARLILPFRSLTTSLLWIACRQPQTAFARPPNWRRLC